MNDFGMQDVYTLQIKRHRRGSDMVSPSCEACQKGFLHVNSLQVREFTQTGKLPGVCKSCNASFLKICRIQIRNMSQNEQHFHVCDLCGKSFTHAGNFMKHKKMHELMFKDEPQNPECPVPVKKENTPMKSSQPPATNTSSKPLPPATNTTSKPLPPATNTSPRPLPPYVCEKCRKVFMKYGSYLNHVDGHENQESLICPICEKTCGTKATFKVHIERCKSRQAVYVCHYCENTFNTKSSLKTHLDTHALATAPKVEAATNVCKFCKESFTVAEELEKHLLQHLSDHNVKEESPEEKEKFNHFCVECNKGFVHLGTLQNHMKTHLNKLPFECKTCKKQFVHSGRLKKHMKLQHLRKWPYTCKLCDKRFPNVKTFKKHKLTVHQE